MRDLTTYFSRIKLINYAKEIHCTIHDKLYEHLQRLTIKKLEPFNHTLGIETSSCSNFR